MVGTTTGAVLHTENPEDVQQGTNALQKEKDLFNMTSEVEATAPLGYIQDDTRRFSNTSGQTDDGKLLPQQEDPQECLDCMEPHHKEAPEETSITSIHLVQYDKTNRMSDDALGLFSHEDAEGYRDEEEEEYDDDDDEDDDYDEDERTRIDNATCGTGTMTTHHLPSEAEAAKVIKVEVYEDDNEGIREWMALGCANVYGGPCSNEDGGESTNDTTSVTSMTSLLPQKCATVVLSLASTRKVQLLHISQFSSMPLVQVFYLQERWFSTEVLLYGMCLGAHLLATPMSDVNAAGRGIPTFPISDTPCQEVMNLRDDLVWLALMSMSSKLHGDISYSPHSLVTRLQGLYEDQLGMTKDEEGGTAGKTKNGNRENAKDHRAISAIPSVTEFCETEWAVFQCLRYDVMISRAEYDAMQTRVLSSCTGPNTTGSYRSSSPSSPFSSATSSSSTSPLSLSRGR